MSYVKKHFGDPDTTPEVFIQKILCACVSFIRNNMALMTRLKNNTTDPLPVDIANNLETLQFESALTEEEKEFLHLRNRTHAITVSACAQATFFVKILHEARCE